MPTDEPPASPGGLTNFAFFSLHFNNNKGTGKTFVGLEILTALIRNTDEQILVICYTNHALDQFLAGVLAITEDIVRMGNQSKNELLDKYNVKQLLETVVSDKRMKNCFYKAKCEYAELMEQFELLQTKKVSDADAQSIESDILTVQVSVQSIPLHSVRLLQMFLFFCFCFRVHCTGETSIDFTQARRIEANQ